MIKLASIISICSTLMRQNSILYHLFPVRINWHFHLINVTFSHTNFASSTHDNCWNLTLENALNVLFKYIGEVVWVTHALRFLFKKWKQHSTKLTDSSERWDSISKYYKIWVTHDLNFEKEVGNKLTIFFK